MKSSFEEYLNLFARNDADEAVRLYRDRFAVTRTDKIELLSYIIQQHGLDAVQCVVVGDREFDMAAARYHGMSSIGVLWGYGSPVELLDAGADSLVSSPDELGELLIDSI